MRKITKSLLIALPVSLALLFGMVGCETTESTTSIQTVPEAPTPEVSVSTTRSYLTPAGQQRGMTYSWKGFPPTASVPAEAQILVEKQTPREAKPGVVYAYTIFVTNRTNFSIDQVSLTETLPTGFEMSNAEPKPEVRRNTLQWDFGRLAPGQREVITITGIAKGAGSLKHANSVSMSFNLGDMVGVVAVIEPVLDMRIVAPANAVINDIIPVEFTLRNTGTATVRDATLVHTLPKGLLTNDGRSSIEMLIGNLEPGDSRELNLNLRGQEVGVYETTMVARGQDGLSASAVLKTSVQRPKLAMETNVPGRRYVGNIIPYTITVKNTGDAVAREFTIIQNLPEGTTLASANEGGVASDNSVVWRVGNLMPGETKRVESRLVAKVITTARSTVEATAVAAEKVSGVMVTDISGIAAILVNVGDVNDPVPLGETETYTVTVTNQGSATATRIMVKCLLEEGMEFVKSSGATKATVEGKVVTFEPLPALEAGTEASWRVIVKAIKPGDVRFTTTVNSDQLTRPVEENEATNFYQ